ncbi:MAG: serine O-acetyltransferase [Fimbriimonas sp.]|nr:serine O-acetyltransferase [Fimbriimonas sp.]
METTVKNRELVEELMARRGEHHFPLQIRSSAKRFAHELLAVLFPHFTDHIEISDERLDGEIQALETRLCEILRSLAGCYPIPSTQIVRTFIERLPSIYHALLLDAKAIYHGDPAAVSVDEVILGYPGFYAIAIYRAAHELHSLRFPLLPRLLSEHAHHHTGVDIHPGATVGRSFFIDHGTGIVVGETAQIGNGVKLYQGVTLGALYVQKNLSQQKRHPTIGDNTVVYANATILGGDTEIGHDSVVGGNAWITESIPPFSIVGRNSEVRTRKPGAETEIEFNI